MIGFWVKYSKLDFVFPEPGPPEKFSAEKVAGRQSPDFIRKRNLP